MAEEAKKVNVFTREGFEKLQEELSERKTTKTAEISARIEEARAQGDLSENSEYDDAREAQRKNAERIAEIEELLKNAEVVDEVETTTKVQFGSKVTLRDEESKEEEVYTIVGQNEVDFFANRISEDSPVAVAIIGKKKGQTAEVTTPAGVIKYKIVKIGK